MLSGMDFSFYIGAAQYKSSNLWEGAVKVAAFSNLRVGFLVTATKMAVTATKLSLTATK